MPRIHRKTTSSLPLLVSLVALSILVTACLSDSSGSDSGGAVELAGEVLVDGLNGPTQLIVAEDGSWWVAQLAGGENDGQGQVLRLDPANAAADPVVMLAGLDKPTGIALFADELWVMERDRLSRGPIEGLVDGTDRVVVADDLPNNGRSQGTLTPDGDRLLYNTSGRLEGDGTPTPGSGTLWAVTVEEATGAVDIEPVADGFKHAYAHLRTPDGTLYTTEMSDGRFDGQPAADELVAVTPGVDHGWPQCVGDNRAVAEYTEANDGCPDAPRSTAVFPPGATPTSVAPIPGRPNMLAVALWNTGQVVVVETVGDSTDYVVAYEGAERPQHLVSDGDRLLLTDHSAGTIISLTP